MIPSIVALIPARAGSKRIVHKNRRLLNGVPLIAYTIASAKESAIFTDIIVSTDDNEIAEIACRMGVCVMSRPPDYATDASSDIDWVRDLIERRESPTGATIRIKMADAFSILRATSPFRSAETIRRAWLQFTSWYEFAAYQYGIAIDSLRAVEPVKQHPCKCWRISTYASGMVMHPYCACAPAVPPHHSSPTQSLPKIHAQNASLEIAWCQVVSEKHSISGDHVMPFETKGWEGFDINVETDFLFAEFLVERGLAVLPEVR